MSSKGSKNFTFNTAPAIQMSRSKISGLSHGVLTSTSLGRLIPFYNEEILPGDTFKVKSSIVCRLTSSFLKPIYGNLKIDTFYFFVPWRLVYDDFPCVFGENKDGYWSNKKVYQIPHQFGQTVTSKSIADYLEIPVGKNSAALTPLYNRAYALIYNEWFRDENYQQPVHIQKGDWNAAEEFNGKPFGVDNYTGMCATISKYRDYFTSALPEPQKGSPVTLGDPGFVPLSTNPNDPGKITGFGFPLRFNNPTEYIADPGENRVFSLGIASTGSSFFDKGNLVHTAAMPGYPSQSSPYKVTGSNLGVNLAEGFTVNDLRLAFQTQKILERDALGSRYIEHIFTTFGVSNGDARLQRPELLGAKSITIDIQQVAQTGSTTEGNPLASLGAYSLSSGDTGFSKAFTEYGCVIGVMAVRQYHSYQQGTPRRFTRYNRLHFYNPALAYIGMMPVKSTEIYAQAPIDDIFGYQRPWAEYRHHQNAVTGEMRSSANNSLDVWHIADEYGDQPVAGSEFITETPDFVDRTIVVDSSVQDQFILDIWHDVGAVRVMPANPMPGLIDHY